MKDRELTCPEGITYVIRNVPDKVGRVQLELHLLSGKMSKLEELGITTYEYSRLVSQESVVLPEMSDYVQAIKQTYGSIRYHIKEFISFETGESLDVVERWVEGKEILPQSARDKLRDFILKGRTELN